MAASAQSDYGYYRAQYHNASTVYELATGTSGTVDNVIAVKTTRHSIFVQRIIEMVTTDNAATTTYQDDNSSQKVIAKCPASPGLGIEVVADFGPEGIQLTEGKNLDIVLSGAGKGAQISIEAYQRVTAVSNIL